MLAHIDAQTSISEEMLSAGDLFWRAWHFDPWAIGPLSLSLALYLYLVRFRWDRHTWLFISGTLIMLLALISPLATIGETYLFSVHMVQHLLMVIVAVPLMILGTPAKVEAWFMRRKPCRDLANVLSIPVIAWLIGIGTLWLWHWPPLYNLTLESRSVHILEHLSFVISSTIFWAALLNPAERYRLKIIPAFIFLFTGGMINTLLAILLTFAPPGLYPYYLNPRDPLGALALIRGGWGIDPAMDQQMGGAVMWVAGGIIFALVLLVLLARWYGSDTEELYEGVINE